MEEKRDTENLIASDTAAAPITPMEEVDVPTVATPLGRSRVRSLARSAGALLAFAMVGLLVLYGASRVFEPKNNGGVGGSERGAPGRRGLSRRAGELSGCAVHRRLGNLQRAFPCGNLEGRGHSLLHLRHWQAVPHLFEVVAQPGARGAESEGGHD